MLMTMIICFSNVVARLVAIVVVVVVALHLSVDIEENLLQILVTASLLYIILYPNVLS